MEKQQMRVATLWTLAAFVFVAVGVTCATAQAQEDEGPIKMVVLNVPGGGSDALIEQIEQLEGIEIKRQGWFLEQIQARGFQPKGIMKRPDDVKWLMDGAELDYILYLSVEGETSYEARLVGPEKGETVFSFPIDRTPDGLSAAGARSMKREVRDYLEEQRRKNQPEPEEPEIAQVDETEPDAEEMRKKASQDKDSARDALSSGWLTLKAGGAMLRRDLHMAGANEAVLAYTSAFYPGLALGVEAFPLGMSNPEFAGIGFYADYTHGFDSVVVLDGEGQEAEASIGHIEVEGGLLYQLGDALELSKSNEARMHLVVGLRHSSFGLPENASLPSISYTAALVGARVSRPAFSDNFHLQAGAEISPIGVFGGAAEQFGETSSTYGFGANLGGKFQATDDIGINIDYKFQLQRTVFEGSGEAGFEDASGFELVQGLTGGLFYLY
jgi:hypothetical protein